MAEPITTNKKKLFEEIASLNTAHDVFFRMSAPIPDKIIMEKGRGLVTYYDLMIDSDSYLAGLLDDRIDAVAGLEHIIIPATEDNEDMRIAEFVRFYFKKMKKLRVDLKELLGAIRIGYSVSEIMWDERNFAGLTKIVPTELKSRRPDRFTFSTDYELLLKSATNREGEPVPAFKFIHFPYNTRYENPYGISVLRACWWPYWFKHHGFKWWVKAAERGAVVTPVGTYPEHFNTTQIDEFEQALKKFMGDQYIAKPEGTMVDFPAIKIDPQFSEKLTKATNEELVFRITGAIHGVSGEGGSLAKAETHDKRFQEKIESDAVQLMAVIQEQLIKPSVLLNFPNVEEFPTFKLKYETAPDTIAISKTLESGASMGIPISIETAADMLQLPIAEDGEDLIQPPITGRLPIEPTTDQERENVEEEVEPEEPEPEKAAGVTVRARAIPIDKLPFSVVSRGEKQIRKIKNLEEGAIEYGMPAYEEIGDQITKWVRQFSNVADAVAAVDSFVIDQTGLEDAIFESDFFATLHGFHDVLNVPGVADELEIENKRGFFIDVGIRFRSNFLKKIFAASEWIPIPPEKAIELFEGRTILERAEFDLLEANARRHATTAAGMSTEVIASRLQPALMNALVDGTPMNVVIDDLADIALSRWHAETIFRTNIQTAYNNGHAEALYHPDMASLIPAFQFIAIVDDRTTDICQERNGMIFSRGEMTTVDVVPPCHYNCRSTIVGVNAAEWNGISDGAPDIRSLEGFGRFTPILN